MLSDSKLMASAAWDAQSLNELKTKAGKDPAANIRPVARQVEGMFVQMMLKSMRETLPKDGMFSSDSTRLYTSMYDQQIAQQMTAGKGLGLADMIVKQTEAAQGIQPQEQTQQVPMKFDLETVTSYQNQALTQMVRKAMPKATGSGDEPLSGDSKDFLAQLSLPARLASEQSGVPHHLILAQAALVERGARGVDVERAFVGGDEAVHAHVRFARVDVRPLAGIGTEAVADRVLDAQRDELQTLERTLDRRHIDANRLCRREPLAPRAVESELVDIVFLGVTTVRDAPEDARGDARMQVGGIAGRPVGDEMHAAGNRLQILHAGGGQVFGKQGFKPARTTGKEFFQGEILESV